MSTTDEPPVMGAGYFKEITTSHRLEEFISRMFDEHPSRNTWFGETNVVWGRIANGFIEEVVRKQERVTELEAENKRLHEQLDTISGNRGYYTPWEKT